MVSKRTQRSRKRDENSRDLFPSNGKVVFKQPPVVRMRRAGIPGPLTKGALDQGYGVVFEFNSLINSGEIAATYDQYCIEWVEYVIELTTPFLAGIPYPKVVVATDYTDGGLPLSETQALELYNAVIYQFGPDNLKFSLKLKPKPGMAAFASSLSTGYSAPQGETWFDTANGGVDHYGLKMWVSDYNTSISTAPQLRTYSVYHLKLKAAK